MHVGRTLLQHNGMVNHNQGPPQSSSGSFTNQGPTSQFSNSGAQPGNCKQTLNF